MVPIKWTIVSKLLKSCNIKLKRIQRDKRIDPGYIASLRLFSVGVYKLLLKYQKEYATDDTAAITKRFFEFSSWTDVAEQNKKILKPLLHRKRFVNLGQLTKKLESLNKNLTPENEAVFVILYTIYIMELYSLFMLYSTAVTDPTFLDSTTAKKMTRTMLAFRRKFSTIFSYDKDDDALIMAEEAMDKLKPLGKSFRALITFNKKLV